jgi:hypothetical protein
MHSFENDYEEYEIFDNPMKRTQFNLVAQTQCINRKRTTFLLPQPNNTVSSLANMWPMVK